MGKWAKSLFGSEKFDKVGIVLAGTTGDIYEKRFLSLFDKVLSSKDRVYHGHLVKKDKYIYPVLTNVYGAPAMMDSLTKMYDGGCRNVIFIGYAYAGFKKSLDIGSIVLPVKSYHFDGIYSPLDPSRTIALPNKELRNKLKDVLNDNGVEYQEGINISVPAVTFQLPHANEKYKRINPLTVEMELSACFSRAKDIGIRSTGVLIISDNRISSIGDETKTIMREEPKFKVLECLVNNLRKFDLPNLKTKRKFDIDEHLASIIELPNDTRNIYKKK